MTTRRSLMLALAGLLAAGCGDGGGTGSAARIPSAAELAGTYDLMTKMTFGSLRPARDLGTALVATAPAGDTFVVLSTPYVSMHGTFGADGTAVLDGTTLGSDAILGVHTVVHAEERDGIYRIAGTLQGPLAHPTDFTMRRPVDANLSGKTGRYRVSLPSSASDCNCATTITLDLAVPTSGSGVADDAAEVGPDGKLLAFVKGPRIVVAPSGRYSLTASYVFAKDQTCHGPGGDGPCNLYVLGILPVEGESASAKLLMSDSLTVEILAEDVTITRLPD